VFLTNIPPYSFYWIMEFIWCSAGLEKFSDQYIIWSSKRMGYF